MAIVETKKGYDPRILSFHGVFAVLLLVLAGGLGYRQLSRSSDYAEKEKIQSQRRILVPGPRGNLYDREGRILVGNRPRFSAVLYLGELRQEFFQEQKTILRNLREASPGVALSMKDKDGIATLARTSVAQRYLEKVNRIVERSDKVDAAKLERHFVQERLLPFMLVDDLTASEYARLLEQLPVRGPLQLYSSSKRWYPYRSAAAHSLGRVRTNDTLPDADMGGDELTTLNIKGTIGDSGIERFYDERLQGTPGVVIYRVDPAGYKLDRPLERRTPVQGKSLTLSLDIDLQLAAERAMGTVKGAAVALDVATGEVLVLASKPDFDLNDLSPTMTYATKEKIDQEGGWLNRAIQGLYPPGSTFKVITSLAALRAGTLHPGDKVVCPGFYQVGGRSFPCHDNKAHGEVDLTMALAKSCNVFYYSVGLDTTIDSIAAEAKRFHLDLPSGIDLPSETRGAIVPDPAWKMEKQHERWMGGDTANTAIGQGFLRYSPMAAACEMASLARRETRTVPTLLHQPGRSPTGDEARVPLQLAEPLYRSVVEGMKAVIVFGTGRHAQVPGISIAGKTGTAQVSPNGVKLNIAWFVAFAPADKPEIAVAVAMEGEKEDSEYGGGTYAAPVAREIFQTYFDKKNRTPASPLISASLPVADTTLHAR